MSEWQKDRETCERAHPGPWFTDGYRMYYEDPHTATESWGEYKHDDIAGKAEGEFIARARTRWPAALDRIAELEKERDDAVAERDRLGELASEFMGHYNRRATEIMQNECEACSEMSKGSTAYARGWEAAKKAAVEAVRATIWADPSDPGKWESLTRESVEDAIRAVKMGEVKP